MPVPYNLIFPDYGINVDYHVPDYNIYIEERVKWTSNGQEFSVPRERPACPFWKILMSSVLTTMSKGGKMSDCETGPYFQAYYREPGPLPRKECYHALFEAPEKAGDSSCQFAKIDKYLFGLTRKGIEMFKCFFDAPQALVKTFGWSQDVIDGLLDGAQWAGERLASEAAFKRMDSLADIRLDYPDGSVLYLFSRGKMDFNVEIYSTPELDFLEGFLIASIDSDNYLDYFSLIIYKGNIIEIECDYGLNPPPDDNPWEILYDGCKLIFGDQELLPG